MNQLSDITSYIRATGAVSQIRFDNIKDRKNRHKR